MKKITKRDVLFLFLGIFLAFLISVIWNVDEHVQAFKDGYQAGACQEEPSTN